MDRPQNESGRNPTIAGQVSGNKRNKTTEQGKRT